jgi:hypothetical protein
MAAGRETFADRPVLDDAGPEHEGRQSFMRIRVLVVALAAFLVICGTAQASLPTASTGGASEITQTTAHLTGSVKPNGEDTTWHFEIGTTTTYGTNTPEQGPISGGAGTTNVAADVGGLTPGTTYHYRVVATNHAGSVAGRDRVLTTRPAISIATSAGTVLFGRSVTISGQIFGSAVNGITVSLRENPYPFDDFTEVATTVTDATGHYQFIRPVLANTAYRVVAQTRPPGTSTTAFVYEQDTVLLKASTRRPRHGKSVLFTGLSAPARIGGDVLIQRLGSHGWRTVARGKLTATNLPNSAGFAVRLRRVRSGAYRALVPDGFDHLAGISKNIRIAVRR